LVTADAIGKSYGDNLLFADLSVRIGTGERWAVSGPSGVGKTTLANALIGLTAVDHGSITRSAALSDGKVQKLYQDPELSFPPRVALRRSLADVERRYDVPAGRVDALLREVGLTPDLLERRPHQLSGGELQRLAVVRAILPRPALLFADEATSRLDLLTQEATANCLMTEVAATGCALLAITHDPDLAAALADHHIELDGDGRAVINP
jgi:peptide/nickel transport system ATP-binding protein